MDGESAAFIACDEALPPGPGVVPCVHALGTRDVLELYREGVRKLLVCRGQCSGCHRVAGGQQLDRTLGNVNSAIASRELAPLRWRDIEPTSWSNAIGNESLEPGGADKARRRFLRGLVARTAPRDPCLPGSATDADDKTALPIGCLLPERDLSDVMLSVPTIDTLRCSGCDACAKLCPHGAISLEDFGGDLKYRIRARWCTGCGICVDVCDRDSVHLDQWTTQSQQVVRLNTSRCSACGVCFHAPIGSKADQGALCPVCERSNHASRLYQVID
jgi:Pyruvate/2-oxoacid:ferredoxin oxidoreductase delta subunit